MEGYVDKGVVLILKRINDSKSIAAASKVAVEKHVAFLRARDANVKTVYKHLFALEKFLNVLGRKDVSKADKEDIEAAISKINAMGLADETKRNIRTLVKQFYKHLLGEDSFYPRQVAWIKTTSSKKGMMLPEDLLTEKDIAKLLDAARSPRDRAIIALLFDSGIRAGELLSMRKKDVDLDSDPAHITVSGKTGMRQIPILFSAQYLAQYLSLLKEFGPNDRLWRGMGPFVNREATLERGGLATLIKKIGKRAGIGKNIYAHLFRHSRASNYANRLTEQQLKVFFGWTGDSKMVATYVHLSGRDIDNAVLQANGVAPKEKPDSTTLTVKPCPRCGLANTVTSTYCARCGAALDIATVIREEERRGTLKSFAVESVAKPETQAKVRGKVKGRKRGNPDAK